MNKYAPLYINLEKRKKEICKKRKKFFTKKTFVISSLAILSFYSLLKNNKDIDQSMLNYPKKNIEQILSEENLNQKKLKENNYIAYDSKKIEQDLINNEFIDAIINVESERNPYARSKKGARGLMQLMPKNWEESGEGDFSNAFDPEKNKKAGIKAYKIIQNYCEKFHPKWKSLSIKEKRHLLVASYNGGKARLKYRGWEINKMPLETKNYLKKLKKENKEIF
jgi:soluble lytic murein transglycosylase-like protein